MIEMASVTSMNTTIPDAPPYTADLNSRALGEALQMLGVPLKPWGSEPPTVTVYRISRQYGTPRLALRFFHPPSGPTITLRDVHEALIDAGWEIDRTAQRNTFVDSTDCWTVAGSGWSDSENRNPS